MRSAVKTAVLIILCALIITPNWATPNPTSAQQAAFGQIARKHLTALAGQIGTRVASTPGEQKAATYIKDSLEDLGYAVEVQKFTYTDDDDETGDSANVIAVKRGLSPKAIVVGAHYDSVDTAKGADDNASGVAAMLELAERLKDVETPYSIRFIAFGAEEVGLIGSDYYVEELDRAARKDIVGMINLDSLAVGDLIYVYSADGAKAVIRKWVLAWAEDKDIDLIGGNLDDDDGTPCECSDYDAFDKAGIPYVFFEATNAELGEQDGVTQVDPKYGKDGEIRHTRFDTIDYIDKTFPGRIDQRFDVFVRLAYAILMEYKA